MDAYSLPTYYMDDFRINNLINIISGFDLLIDQLDENCLKDYILFTNLKTVFTIFMHFVCWYCM